MGLYPVLQVTLLTQGNFTSRFDLTYLGSHADGLSRFSVHHFSVPPRQRNFFTRIWILWLCKILPRVCGRLGQFWLHISNEALTKGWVQFFCISHEMLPTCGNYTQVSPNLHWCWYRCFQYKELARDIPTWPVIMLAMWLTWVGWLVYRLQSPFLLLFLMLTPKLCKMCGLCTIWVTLGTDIKWFHTSS